MEALLSQFSFLSDQALNDKNFDPSRIDELMELFEGEVLGSWAAVETENQKAHQDAKASMKEAEEYLNSLMGAAMDNSRRYSDEIERSSKEELSSLDHAGETAKKMGHALGTATTAASKKYVDAALDSATATMKSSFSTSKVHPS